MSEVRGDFELMKALKRLIKSERYRVWAAANRDRLVAKNRKWNIDNRDRKRESHLLRKYGLSAEVFRSLCDAQDNTCLICTKAFGTSKPSSPCVDHCHFTRLIRGIICYSCNVGLGHFYDDPQSLRRAADYIETSQQVPQQ